MTKTAATVITLALTLPVVAQNDPVHVGPDGQGGVVVPTRQIVHPAGQSVEWHGRPTEVVVAPGGDAVYVKNYGSLLSIDPETWKIRQELKLPEKTNGTMT